MSAEKSRGAAERVAKGHVSKAGKVEDGGEEAKYAAEQEERKSEEASHEEQAAFEESGGTTQSIIDKLKGEEGAIGFREKQIRSPQFKGWFGDWEKYPENASKVVDEKGKPLIVYSGHSNVAMYGNKYDPRKGTAGGFYASEDPKISSNYATGKFGVYESFEHGSEYRLAGKDGRYNKKLWQVELTPEQKAKLENLKEARDEYGNNVHQIAEMDRYIEQNASYDPQVKAWEYRGGSGSLQNIHDFYEMMGNTIIKEAETPAGAVRNPVEQHIQSDFDDLLDELGIKWNSYDKPMPAVMPIYLSIRNPLDASKPFPKDLLAKLQEVAKYKRKVGGQQWTKDYSFKQWVNDIASGSEYWSTQIPKEALPILKSFGYDGVKELGMKGAKNRAERQINWIAFDPEQIKSATGNVGKFDPTNPDIRGKAPLGMLALTGATAAGGLAAGLTISHKGQIKPPNIDLSKRPVLKNKDGSVSTVLSKGFDFGDGHETLIPTVVNGKKLTNKEAIDHYKKTGEHLGIYADVASANAAAEKIHQQEAKRTSGISDVVSRMKK
jgi:hypothetical protein